MKLWRLLWVMCPDLLLLQVAADAVTRWLYPHLDEEHRLIDLAAQQQQHRDFLTAWMDLMTSADNMMPFDKVSGLSAAAAAVVCMGHPESHHHKHSAFHYRSRLYITPHNSGVCMSACLVCPRS